MRKPVGILLGITLVATCVSAASAAPRKHKPVLENPTFAEAGTFSGPVTGHVVFNGVEYFIPANVRAYEVGRGAMDSGAYVNMRMVSLSGIYRNGSRIVTQLIVRPEGFGTSGPDVGIADANRPR